ncbi:hypothetical protein KFL_001400200 [Klebsormidium nitens]|uniref:Uncharacterized protein n=1 Tax=Klebsormidium nitens TaxID=105231 RepID=A0A1Y1I3C6_KLENI|nr:hypothetical protein KFL_001400200 [Klebsormidium nitens]|eukprot:GAQ83236.1 hypothetical protein KFL_001400200 [Klebsormidium nitens]
MRTGTFSAAPRCRPSPFRSDIAAGSFRKGQSTNLQAKGCNADSVDQLFGIPGPRQDACRGTVQLIEKIHGSLIRKHPENGRKSALRNVHRPGNWLGRESSGSHRKSSETGKEVHRLEVADEGRAAGIDSAPGDHCKHPTEVVKRQFETVKGRRGFLAASTCLCKAVFGCKASHADSSQGEALCSQCHGSGAVPCNLCGGTGQWRQGFQNGIEQTLECPQCSGRGLLKCVRCLGTGLGDTGGLLRGAAVKEGHMRVRADGSIEILDCDYFPATRGKDCRPSANDNRLTEDRALSAPRGGLYPRPDLVDIAKKTWRIVEGGLET